MKKYLFIATALVALVSCSDDTFVGDQGLKEANENGRAIGFNLNTPAVTRADDNHTPLANNFVVYGYKTIAGENNTTTTQTVFDNYQVNWVTNTAHTTESNSADWEYVSYKNLPFGTGTKSGDVITLNNNGVATNANSTGIDQSIKYWDFSASAYDFFAYSLGAGSSSTWAKASAMNKTGYGASSANPGYTLEGTAAQLGTCYISNKKNVVPSTSTTEVDLEFRSFLSQIELKFYETIPGYSVKEVKFYPSAAGAAGTTPYLFANSNVLPTGGKYTVTFDSDGKAQLTFDTSEGSTTSPNVQFGTTLSRYAIKEYKETTDVETEPAVYLGRTSTAATSTDLISVLPNPQNNNALHLKMDFTLLSRDGTGETINMTGATAVVPAGYAMWKPNYKYTYIFKISDNTNAKIGAITGLYPITLDAVVTDAGTQETITTVDDPSITTYAKGTMVTANNEYLTGANIYIVVNDGTNITANSDAKLYTAAITLESGENPRPAAQGITEATVANAIAHSGSVTDANGATLTVTAAAGLSDISAIAAEDAPDGKAITIDGVMFTPAAAGDYVFEYTAPAENYSATEAAAYNAGLTGALPNDGTTGLTADQANAYNAKLSGAIAAGTALTADQATAVNAVVGANTYSAGGEITAEHANAYNATLSGHIAANATITTDQANAYNATLPGAVTSGDVQTPAAKHYKVIKVVAAGS